MRILLTFLCLVCIFSCVPIRIAPTIKEDKVMLAKKFKRKLPKKFAYIFEDPKDADEFYDYINIKYQLNYIDVEFNVPVVINEIEYFLSFHETEIPTKTLNLVPLLIDAKRESNGREPFFDGAYTSRYGNWYLVLTMADSEMNDCLNPDYVKRAEILEFFKKLRLEYLGTANYFDALLKK